MYTFQLSRISILPTNYIYIFVICLKIINMILLLSFVRLVRSLWLQKPSLSRAHFFQIDLVVENEYLDSEKYAIRYILKHHQW